jgi:hypothetical protein
MEARQDTAEHLEVIARRYSQIPIGSRIVDHLKFAKQPTFEIGRDAPRLRVLDEEGAQPLFSEADDHAAIRMCTHIPLSGTQDNSRGRHLARGLDDPAGDCVCRVD